jgi:hypothetical protein
MHSVNRLKTIGKSIITFIFLGFISTLVINGLFAFSAQPISKESTVYFVLAALSNLIIAGVSFFGSSYILGKEISKSAGIFFVFAIFGLLLVVVVISPVLGSKVSEYFMKHWFFFILIMITCFGAAYLGTNLGFKQQGRP